MVRLLLVALVLSITSGTPAAEPRVVRNLAYVPGGGRGQSLDLYLPTGAERPGLVVWIHGGGWKIGDKSRVEQKPAYFHSRGFAVASINYRLVPDTDWRGQAADIAAAVAWLRQHAREYGYDGDRVVLVGHSAGAHLAALVATDHQYFQKAQVPVSAIRSVVLLDGAGYDVATQMKVAGPLLRDTYTEVFGTDPANQRDASPTQQIRAGVKYPPVLVLHVADRLASRVQSQRLARRLREVGGTAEVHAAEGKTHATINRELGIAGDEPTRVVGEFLDRHAAAQAGQRD